MYLDKLKINSFRKYKELTVRFNSGLNLLVGENDSGKTAIVDAIKYVLHTQSFEYVRPNYEDFHLEIGRDENERSDSFSIECFFKGFKDVEAKSFIEWLGVDEEGAYYLKVWLIATRKNGKVYYDLKAGPDEEGTQITGEARDLLRTTYLKPLRDAESELTPKRGSRLSQILDNHDEFTDKENHRLKRIMNLTNKAIERFFTRYDGKDILQDINNYLSSFSLEANQLNSKFQVSENSLKSILEKLSLKLFNHETSENNIQGLGSNNLLYIAAELLLLKKLEFSGLKLGLIEEVEAHLHPQTQIRLIEAIQSVAESNHIQFILTTHSPNLASKVKLNNLIVCRNGSAYPMGSCYTKLSKGDYFFLERFLDSTKANMFFANGVILVEGDAENILLPTIAKKINLDLSKHGVSIVNVGSTAFLRYANIFLRQADREFNLRVSLITDVDVKPFETIPKQTKKVELTPKIGLEKATYKDVELTEQEVEANRLNTITKKRSLYPLPIKSFIAPHWTLEYSIARSVLSKPFWSAVYLCWKTKGKDYVYMLDDKLKFTREAEQQYSEWVRDKLSADEIAYNIYKETLLNKKLSKAVVAQVFAQILDEGGSLNIKSDQDLKYLVHAIEYATGSTS